MIEVVVGILAFIVILLLVAAAGAAGIWWSRRERTAGDGSTVKHIALHDGQWAKVRTRLTQGMWDAILAARPHNLEQSEDGRVLDAAGADVTEYANDMLTRALIVSGVTRWSYGEVEMETLVDNVPLEDQQTLADYLDAVLVSSPHFRRVTGGI